MCFNKFNDYDITQSGEVVASNITQKIIKIFSAANLFFWVSFLWYGNLAKQSHNNIVIQTFFWTNLNCLFGGKQFAALYFI